MAAVILRTSPKTASHTITELEKEPVKSRIHAPPESPTKSGNPLKQSLPYLQILDTLFLADNSGRRFIPDR